MFSDRNKSTVNILFMTNLFNEDNPFTWCQKINKEMNEQNYNSLNFINFSLFPRNCGLIFSSHAYFWCFCSFLDAFQANVPFLCPLNATENLRFYVFRGYKKTTIAWNWLMTFTPGKNIHPLLYLTLKKEIGLQKKNLQGEAITLWFILTWN